MKLIEKVRVGSKVRKVYEKIPKSPYMRLLESPDISEEAKAELKRRFICCNPVLLQKEVHRAVNAPMAVYERKSLPASAHKQPRLRLGFYDDTTGMLRLDFTMIHYGLRVASKPKPRPNQTALA
jgi:hypothetical protein